MREVIATGKTVEEATEAGCTQLGLSRSEVTLEILAMPQKKFFKTIPAKVKVTAIEDDAAESSIAFEQKSSAPIMEKAQFTETKPTQQKKMQAQNTSEKPQQSMQNPPQTSPETASDEVSDEASAGVSETTEGRVLQSEPEVPIDLALFPQVQKAVDYLSSIFSAMGLQDVSISALRQGDATLLRVSDEHILDRMEVRGEVIQALSYLVDRAVNAGIDKKEDIYLRIRLDVEGYRNRRETELVEMAMRIGNEVAKTGRSRTLAPMNPYERLIVHTTIGKIEGVFSSSIGADVQRRVVIKSLAPNATDGGDYKGDSRGKKQGGQRRDNSRGSSRSSGGRSGAGQGRAPRQGARTQRSFTPEREFAKTEHNPSTAPVVPKRREAIRDGEDLPLYGKIEL